MATAKTVQLFYQQARGWGHSHYLLVAAVNNPNVVIVADTRHLAGDLKRRYQMMISELSLSLRIWRWLNKKHFSQEPYFCSVEDLKYLRDEKPIMLDNSVLCSMFLPLNGTQQSLTKENI